MLILWWLDYLVPALTDLTVSVMSASSFTVTAPSSKDIKLPPILGFRVHWATNYDMTENLRSSAVLPCDMKSHLFDGLQEGIFCIDKKPHFKYYR